MPKRLLHGPFLLISALLRAAGQVVLSHARDLGGLMSYGKTTGVSDRLAGCAALAPVWQAISRSFAHVGIKFSVIPAKCWSSALHGINGCPVSDSVIHTLRTAACRALHWKVAGSSSLLRFALCGVPEADPGFYQVWKVLLDFRQIAAKQPALFQRWEDSMAHYSGTFYQGPF